MKRDDFRRKTAARVFSHEPRRQGYHLHNTLHYNNAEGRSEEGADNLSTKGGEHKLKNSFASTK